METITRLFDHHTNALAAVSALEAAGYSPSDISIVSNNADNWHAGHRHQNDAVLTDDDSEAAEGAGKGAVTGGALGASAGILAGLGMLAIPGLCRRLAGICSCRGCSRGCGWRGYGWAARCS